MAQGQAPHLSAYVGTESIPNVHVLRDIPGVELCREKRNQQRMKPTSKPSVKLA